MRNACLYLLYNKAYIFQINTCYYNLYVHIATRFKGLKGSECLFGASELSVKKLAHGIKTLA